MSTVPEVRYAVADEEQTALYVVGVVDAGEARGSLGLTIILLPIPFSFGSNFVRASPPRSSGYGRVLTSTAIIWLRPGGFQSTAIVWLRPSGFSNLLRSAAAGRGRGLR
jgi:hypothetical protein